MSKLKLAERLLWIFGFLLIGIYALVYAERTLFQSYGEREFERALERRPPAGKTEPARTFARGDTIGRLEIPRIGLQALVLEGADDKTLRRAIGHIEGTPFPGQPGNVAISAHRDTFFRNLGKLKRDDTVRFTTLDGIYEYAIDSIDIVRPVQTDVLRDLGRPTLTLVTCYPFSYVGRAPKRYIIHARQVRPQAPALMEAGGLY